VFAGSFDPLTLGHLDVIERASKLFDRVVVAMGESRGKAPLFTTEERAALIEAECARLGNVEPATFRGLAVEFAKAQGAVAFIRGVRSSLDFAYEMQMAQMNRALAPAIETIFIPTAPLVSHISSSLAKEIAKHGGDLALLVPPRVAKRLARKVRDRD
jgi:pantetheine-phosphate adenylyltransferase